MGGGRVLTVDEQTKDMARLKLKARKKKDIVRPAGAAHSKDIHMAGSKDMARTKDTPTMKDTARSKDMAGSKDTVGSKDNNRRARNTHHQHHHGPWRHFRRRRPV